MTAQSVRKNGMKSSEELRAVWKMKLKANSHTIYRWEGNEITSLMVLVARIEETCAEVKRLGEKQWLPVRTKDETGEKPSEMVAKVLGFVEGCMRLKDPNPVEEDGDPTFRLSAIFSPFSLLSLSAVATSTENKEFSCLFLT